MRLFRAGGGLTILLLLSAAAIEGQSSLTAPYASFIASPYAATVAAGGSEQFSAVGMGDADVQWTATGGTITSTGLYLAGSAPGTYVVTATSGERSSSVPVVIASASSAPASRMPVAIQPGQSIQDAVNANPAGTMFLIKRGVHRQQYVRPKDGNMFVGEAGAVLDGEGVARQAFDLWETRNVTIRGLRIANYVPPELNAALEGGGSEGSLIEGNEIDHNSNGALRAYGLRLGNTSVVRRNSIHHNGWLGIVGYQAMDTVIEGNDIYANPPAWFDDKVGEAANMKLFDCGRITIRLNYVHDGIFKGIWVDTMRPDVTIERNRVINHGNAGIWYEVSYRGVIRNNYVENAGYNQTQIDGWLRGGGIEVSNSRDVSVLNNTVVNSLNGIIGLEAESYQDGPYGASELRNLLVQGNRIVMTRGQTGIAENVGSAAVFTSWNNWFVDNRYVITGNDRPFQWMGQSLDERQWQSYGQGAGDRFVR